VGKTDYNVGGLACNPHNQSPYWFWFLVCYATTQLATQLQQRCIQVVCSNTEARKRLTESNGTSTMVLVHMNVVLKGYYFNVLFDDYCFEVDIRIRRYINKRSIEPVNKTTSQNILFQNILFFNNFLEYFYIYEFNNSLINTARRVVLKRRFFLRRQP